MNNAAGSAEEEGVPFRDTHTMWRCAWPSEKKKRRIQVVYDLQTAIQSVIRGYIRDNIKYFLSPSFLNSTGMLNIFYITTGVEYIQT